jgi:chemotaxis protein MotB
MNRRPRYLQSGDSTGGKWLVSYSDIVTILLVLFVALAAQAYQERLVSTAIPKPPSPVNKAALPALHSGAAPDAPEPPLRKPSTTLQAAERALRARGIQPDLENRGLVISLPQAILFPSGEDRIDPAALPAIAQIVEVVGAIPNQISLVGHTDAVPIHSLRFRNNWELATARSVNLLELLTTRYGIQESRLSIASPGTYSPKGSNDTEDGRAGNRRVEIIILPEVAGETPATAK